jgi:hypothetical protein
VSAAGSQKNKPKEIRIPVSAFKERVRRDSNALAREALGMTLEEARAKLSSAAAATPAAPAGTPAAAADHAAALRKAERQLAEANKRAQDIENKYKKDTRRLKDAQMEQAIKSAAFRAGVADDERATLAVQLFARAVMADNTLTPETFYGTLKNTHPYLFGNVTPAAPVVVAVPAGTAPKASTLPGESLPTPTPTTPGGGTVDVDKMSPTAFNKHMQGTYGYRPGM